MNGYERRKQRKREQILRASQELFRMHGFKKVSVADIARQAHVSQVTIYNHFESKESLIRETLKHLLEAKLDEYQEILLADRPYLDKVESILMDKTALMDQFRGELFSALYRDHPELIAYADGLRREILEKVTFPFLDKGRELGYVPKGIDNQAVFLTLQIIRHGFMNNPDVLETLGSNPRLMNDVFSLLIHGIIRSP
jgi:AcrR family transcriptional regulator